MRYLTRGSTTRVAVCMAVLGALLAGPVAGASASDSSIKAVIKSYDSKILVAEGHVVTALGEYKTSGNPSGVNTAIAQSVTVLSSLKNAIASQSASTPKVKTGKKKFEKGLQTVIAAYEHLKTAFGEKQGSPTAAKEQAVKALTALKKAKADLREGAKLLT